jgi:hypothetical protein
LARGRGPLLAAAVATLALVTPRIRGADEIEYFSYLPSLVIDRDLQFGDEYASFHARDPVGLAGFKATFLDGRDPVTGRHINFAPIGSALLWSPFYLLAHAGTLGARALGAPVAADGHSWPYVAAACYASALYGVLGLFLVHDLLVRYGAWPAPAATLAVLGLWMGTPVLYYLVLAPAFSHASSLFAVALLLWLWLRARARGPRAGLGPWFAVGLAGGLAALIREQDALFLAIPALAVCLEGARAPARAAGRLAAMAAAAAVAFLPQLLVYRVLHGRLGPSRLVTRKMTWTSPHFLEVLFDPAHGLFLWAPLLLLATVGLALAWRRDRVLAGALAAGLLLQVWINGAVESWTQAGAFGSRRFLAATPIFAWGLVAIVARFEARWGRGAITAVLAAFAWWNLSLMVQFGLKLMDRQGLEWPRVALNQVREVPRQMGRAAVLYLTDRERLVQEAP